MSFKQVLLCVTRKPVYPYQTELSEILEEPEDIIDAVEKSKETGDHTEIHKILTNRNINLRSPIEEEGKTRTIARKILEDAVNGNKIVKKELDDHVKELDDKKDSVNYAVEVDFEGILCEDSYKQTMVVYDLLDLRAEQETSKICYCNVPHDHWLAFAFMVVNYGHDQETFENPIKSSIMTLTMALGEFNFEDFYNTFKEDSTSRGFAMVLLVLLILFGTITMVNLFIAVTISDISQLREDVYTQNLINMAQCSIMAEELLPNCILSKMRVDDKETICMHELCPKGCKGTKLPSNMKQVFEHLKQIFEETKKTKEREIFTNEIILGKVNVRVN